MNEPLFQPAQEVTDRLDPRIVASPPSELDQAVSQLVDTRRRLTYLKELEKQQAARVRALVPVGTERKPAGDVLVSVGQPMKFSVDRAKEILGPDVLKSITVTVSEIDPDLAQQVLPGQLYEACKVPNGQPRITFGGK